MGHSDSQEVQRLYRRVSHIHHQMWAVRPPKTSRKTMEETNQLKMEQRQNEKKWWNFPCERSSLDF